MRRFRLLLLTACTLGLGAATPALAVPGDPPITQLTPAAGALLPGSTDGIEVRFACPEYRSLVFDGQGYYDGPENYRAVFSLSPTVGADGEFPNDDLGLPSGFSSASAISVGDGTCRAVLDTTDDVSTNVNSPDLVGGTIHWQVYRLCGSCDGGVDVSSVSSFVVTPRAPKVSLRTPSRLYAGYLGLFDIELDVSAAGVTFLTLERQAGSQWQRVTTGLARADRVRLSGVLPVGRQRLRLRAQVGTERFTVRTTTVTVRRDRGRRTAARDDGRYRDKLPIEQNHGTATFRVERGGRRLRAFRASVPGYCIGLPPAGTTLLNKDDRIVLLFANADSAKVAPDGTVTQKLARGEEADGYLVGKLRRGRFTGRVELRFGTCFGSRKVTAQRG